MATKSQKRFRHLNLSHGLDLVRFFKITRKQCILFCVFGCFVLFGLFIFYDVPSENVVRTVYAIKLAIYHRGGMENIVNRHCSALALLQMLRIRPDGPRLAVNSKYDRLPITLCV